MASIKEAQRLIAGGVDFNSPADKIANGVARQLENWRIDQNNQLRSRRGSTLAGTYGSGNFHSIYPNAAGLTVLGVGSGVFTGAGLTNPTISAPGSLDGTRFGIASYLGYTYLMNKTAQWRFSANGDHAYPWCPAAPASKPTAAAITPSLNVLNNYDGTSGYDFIYTLVEGAPDQFPCMQHDTPDVDPVNGAIGAIDNVNYQSAPASIRCTVNQKSTINFASFGGTWNTTASGVASDTDVFSFWLYCSDPTHIDSVTLSLAGALQGAPIVQCTVPASALTQAANSWTNLKFVRRLNIPDYLARIAAATDSGIATDIQNALNQAITVPTLQIVPAAGYAPGINISYSTQTINWAAIYVLQITVIANDSVQVNINQLQVSSVGSSTASLTGTGSYYVSFVDEAGHDGPVYPTASNAVTVNNQGIQLTSIPVSAAANVGKRRIWRVGFGNSTALLVDTINDNTTTTWTDPTTTNVAQGSAVFLPDTRTVPPAAAGVVGPYFGKLVAFNTTAFPSRFFWTDAGVAWSFPDADSTISGNWEDAGDADPILAATAHKTMMIFYKGKSIWRLPGDPATTDVIQTNSNVGVVGSAAVVNGGAIDYFVASEGVFSFNADTETKISKDIDGIFKGDTVQLDASTTLQPVNQAYASTICIGIINERLRVSYPEVGHTTPNCVLIYNTITQQWAVERYPVGFSAMAYWGNALPMTGGAPGGGWYALESGASDSGTAIALKWQTGVLNQGLPDFAKWYSDLEIEAWLGVSGSSVTLNVYAIFDDLANVISLGTITVSGVTKQVFNLKIPEKSGDKGNPAGGTDYGYRSLNCCIRITGNASNEIILGGVYLHSYTEERLANTFDSGATDFGLPEKVKQVDYLEFYQTGSGQTLQRTLSSDLPGRLLTIRDQANMTAPNGRGDVRFRLANIVEGRNFRLTVDDTPSSTAFQLHKARARMRPVGEYVDGSNSEYFESAEFSVSPGRVGELKDLLLDYDVSGAGGSLRLYSDLPGSSGWQLVRTIAIPYDGTALVRNPYVFPFDDESDQKDDFLPVGQLFKVRMYPPSGGILRLHGRAQFRGRIVGSYFNGANSEIFQTQPVELFGDFGIAREVQCTLVAAGAMTLSIATEMSNDANDIPASPPITVPLNPIATTPGRLNINQRLPGNMKGVLWRFTISGNYICRLFELKVFGRRLGPNPTPWGWVNVPLEITPDEWANIQMPCGKTPDEFTWIDVPVDPVGIGQ